MTRVSWVKRSRWGIWSSLWSMGRETPRWVCMIRRVGRNACHSPLWFKKTKKWCLPQPTKEWYHPITICSENCNESFWFNTPATKWGDLRKKVSGIILVTIEEIGDRLIRFTRLWRNNENEELHNFAWKLKIYMLCYLFFFLKYINMIL